MVSADAAGQFVDWLRVQTHQAQHFKLLSHRLNVWLVLQREPFCTVSSAFYWPLYLCSIEFASKLEIKRLPATKALQVHRPGRKGETISIYLKAIVR